jgi:hypothetical protein
LLLVPLLLLLPSASAAPWLFPLLVQVSAAVSNLGKAEAKEQDVAGVQLLNKGGMFSYNLCAMYSSAQPCDA